MSVNTCSITGLPIQHPVISRLTGHIYQKQPIQKHLSTFPYCPITNKPMQLSDLLQVAQPTTTSFSSLSTVTLDTVKPNESVRVFMTNLQNQYDTLVLEMHYLRQALKETRREIMHTAYRNQAAERVIGNLLKEKAETQAQILGLRHDGTAQQ